MKIERINENQIRCTLSREDLAERQIELSELAYGSEKARRLFHEMIQAAADEVGFDVENVPIMVEAIPLSMEHIMLIVTRVEDPDELDTRFSRFSPAIEEDWQGNEDSGDFIEDVLDGADDIIASPAAESAGSAVSDASASAAQSAASAPAPARNDPPDAPPFRLFAFAALDLAIQAAGALKGCILAQSSLYKTPDSTYILVVTRGDDTDAFHRICNTLSEYGSLRNSRASILAYLEEHCEVIIASRALDKLARL